MLFCLTSLNKYLSVHIAIVCTMLHNLNFRQYIYFSFFLVSVYSVYAEKESVIIDADPGADDAMAIIMLLASKKQISVEAITCVQGNTGAYNVSVNVLKILDVMDRLDIPVYPGSPTGLVYTTATDNYFGMDGFGDIEYYNPPDIRLLKKTHSAVALAEKVKEKPGVITVIGLGPLTNLALASLINPDFFHQVKRIIILGGSLGTGGNIGPGIEFNIYADAEAAASFFNRVPKNTPTFLLPFETISKNAFSMSWRLEKLGKLESAKMAFLNLVERKTFFKSEWLCFDPTVAAAMINPDIITGTMIGQPIVDTSTHRGYMNITFGSGSVKIITALNKLALQKTLIATLK